MLPDSHAFDLLQEVYSYFYLKSSCQDLHKTKQINNLI